MFVKMSDFQLIIIVFALIHVCFESFLNALNLRKLLNTKDLQPEETKVIMNENQWRDATDYTVEKTKFSLYQDFFSFVLFLPIIIFLYPWVFQNWDATKDAGIFQCAFISVAFLLVVQFPSLIFDWFKQFYLEEKFGFNKSTPKLWASDKLKENVLGLILGTLIFGLLIWLYRMLSGFSEYWWLFAFSAFFLFQLAMMLLWPKFILPLFNKLSPLEDGSLKERLFDLAKRTGFAAQTIDVIDGSKRSSHSNAFFTGFGKFRRIVLYDTLINQMKESQVEAVLAHEIGHYKKGHIPKRLFFSFITGLMGFYFLSLGMSQPWLFSELNLPNQYIGSMSAVLIGAILIIPNFTYWLSPISNVFSRKHEYEADRFARDAMGGGKELVEALQQLYRENLSHPSPHWLLVFFHYSHPTFFDRKNALEAY